MPVLCHSSSPSYPGWMWPWVAGWELGGWSSQTCDPPLWISRWTGKRKRFMSLKTSNNSSREDWIRITRHCSLSMHQRMEVLSRYSWGWNPWKLNKSEAETHTGAKKVFKKSPAISLCDQNIFQFLNFSCYLCNFHCSLCSCIILVLFIFHINEALKNIEFLLIRP